MEWYTVLAIVFFGMLFLLATGMPVAYAFLLIIVVGSFVFLGGTVGLEQLIISIYSNLAAYGLFPLPLFIFMGELLLHSGIAPILLDTIDRWLRLMPGRLGLLAVAGGTLLSVLSGASAASVAMLGETLVPEMEKRGYKKEMSLGPIMGSGGLAVMIPPSGLAIFIGAVGEISIGKLLIGGITPGLLMASLYAGYIVIRCWLKPSIAPPYEVAPLPILRRLAVTIRHVLPIGFIIFMVTGIIFGGIATPSEAAATGVLGTFIILATYGRLNWRVVNKAIGGTLRTTGMLFLIICGAKAFSSILAFTGSLTELSKLVTGLTIPPIFIINFMQLMVLIMGCFMDPGSITMITLPVFIPIIDALGFSRVWFGIIYLLNIETGLITPPFGLNLFVMKAVAPPNTTTKDLYLSVVPFVGANLIIMALLIAFPSIALWLPSMMR